MLDDKNKVVSYYAAFKLSYLPERQIAARALPVLLTILDREKDDELRDRAKIAVMRMDPARLKETGRPTGKRAGKMLTHPHPGKKEPASDGLAQHSAGLGRPGPEIAERRAEAGAAEKGL